MKTYAFVLLGDYDSTKNRMEIKNDHMSTLLCMVRTFEEAKQCVQELYEQGVGAIELCGAFGKEKAAVLAELTHHEVAIGYVVHDKEMDSLFAAFFN